MTRTKLIHWFLLLGGLLAELAPDITGMAAALSALGLDWLNWVVRGLGILALIGTRWSVIRGKLAPFLKEETPASEAETKLNVVRLPPPSSGTTVVALLALGTALLLAVQARADGPQFGGNITPNLRMGPSAAITLVSFNLADSTFSGGVSPGLGYGCTWTPPSAPWATLGADLYASFRLGQDLPNQAAFALMGHFADYLFVGVGPTVTQRDGQQALVQWSILGGMGVPLGGTPKYVAIQGAR